MRLQRRVVAITTAVTLGIGLGATAAMAVNPISTGGALDVVEQTVLLSWVPGTPEVIEGEAPVEGEEGEVPAEVPVGPGTQRMLIEARAIGQLEAGAQTVFLIATPTTPTVTEGSSDVLQGVAEASAPEVVIEEAWWPDLSSFGGRSEAEAEARTPTYAIAPDGIGAYPPEPAPGWISWFAERNFQLTDQDVAIIERYAGAGWALSTVSVEIPAGSVNGGPPPIEVTFESTEPVVPMVLSSANVGSLAFTSYVIAEQRMDRTDSLRGNAQTQFSGEITTADHPELADWLAPFGGSAVLTKSVQTFPNPSRLTEDVRFAPSELGAVDPGTEVRVVDRVIFGLPAGLMLVAFGMIAVAVLGIVASRLLQRRYR